MNEFKLCVPCLLGLEGPISDELRRMKMQDIHNENGRVYFAGGAQEIARANINLRIGERVLLELGRFKAETFDELFERTKALPWEQLIPRDAAFPVKGYSLNSKLFSVSDCQKIIKKAVVERLKSVYGIEWFAESAETYQIQFSIMKDEVSLCIDTSGEGLHKRGYRPAHNAAPLKETMAAAMVSLSRYRGREDFCDPFCGSGTIPIEAALIAKNRAPGLYRGFSAMRWRSLDSSVWQAERELAKSREFNGDYNIVGSDIDPAALEIARENADKVDRVDGYIKNGRLYLRVMDYKSGTKKFSLSDIWYGLNMQMIIYLYALQQEGLERYRARLTAELDEIVPAGVLYVPVHEELPDTARGTDEDGLRILRDKALRRSGLLSDDMSLLEAMEHGLEGDGRFIPVSIKIKKGEDEPTLAAKSAVADLEKFGRLARYTQKKLLEMGQELRRGSVEADPRRQDRNTSYCDWCAFRAACRFDETAGDKARWLRRLSDEDFWQQIGGDENAEVDNRSADRH